jgi:SAM-dependent methyltransferase
MSFVGGVIERFRRKRKEDWEFKWQSTRWAQLFRDPATQAKCREYWVRYRHLDDILRLVPMDGTSKILDVGCGISTVLHFLPGERCGVDPIADRYKTVYRYPPELDIRQGYAESLPFEDDRFDVVFCSNCIDHTEDPGRAVAEIRRVVRPGGRFVLTCEVFPEDVGVRNAGHPHSMTASRLRALATNFATLASWDAPWIGLRAYALGEPATERQEHILLLEKSR